MKAEVSERRVKELDARGLRTVGVFVFPVLAREHLKAKGRYMRKRMDMS